jgi:hypothetical protein
VRFGVELFGQRIECVLFGGQSLDIRTVLCFDDGVRSAQLSQLHSALLRNGLTLLRAGPERVQLFGVRPLHSLQLSLLHNDTHGTRAQHTAHSTQHTTDRRSESLRDDVRGREQCDSTGAPYAVFLELLSDALALAVVPELRSLSGDCLFGECDLRGFELFER